MHRFVACIALLLVTRSFARADFINLDDIQFWTGEGPNRAGLVIDWKGGPAPQSLAWGFRWSGTATGEDMLRALAASDSGIRAVIHEFTGFGYSVFGLGYDQNHDGFFNTNPALTFVNGIAVAPDALDTRISADPADRYEEAWYTDGFWTYWNRASSHVSTPWVDGFGMTGRVLSDGNFDGWVLNTTFAFPGPAPSDPVAASAVPEPGSLVLLAVGLMIIVRRQRRWAARIV